MNRWYTIEGTVKITKNDAKRAGFPAKNIKDKDVFYQNVITYNIPSGEKFSSKLFKNKQIVKEWRLISLYRVLKLMYFSAGGHKRYSGSGLEEIRSRFAIKEKNLNTTEKQALQNKLKSSFMSNFDNIFASEEFYSFLEQSLKKRKSDKYVGPVVTKKFHIPPGTVEKDKVGTAYIQVIVEIDPKLDLAFTKFLNKIEPKWNNSLIKLKPTRAGTQEHIEKRVYDVQFQENIEGLKIIRDGFKILHKKNLESTKGQYAYNFKIMVDQVDSFMKELELNYSEGVRKQPTSVYSTAAAAGTAVEKTPQGSKSKSPKEYTMQYSFLLEKAKPVEPKEQKDKKTSAPTPPPGNTTKEDTEGSVLIPTPAASNPNRKISFQEPPILFHTQLTWPGDEKRIFTLNEELFAVPFPGRKLMAKYSRVFMGILYDYVEVLRYLKKPPEKIYVTEFVEKFFDPQPERLPPPIQVSEVYNKSLEKTKHKSQSDLQKERLAELTKLQVFKKYKDKYNQVGDNAYIQIIKNHKKIKTVDDVFKYVIKVIPLDSLIQEATDCLLKQLPNTNYKKEVCDFILFDLTMEDLDKIVSYLEKQVLTGMEKVGADDKNKKEFQKTVQLYTTKHKKAEVDRATATLKKFVNTSKQLDNQERAAVIEYINSDLETRDIICAAILASIPAALSLLSRLDSENLTPPIPWKKIINPAKEFLEKIGDAFSGIKITSITGDWKSALKALVLGFIGDFIVRSVQTILEQIAEVCEGTSESDFAGMGMLPGEGPPPTLDVTYPFVPFAIRDMINAAPEDPPYASLARDLGPHMSEDLIKDFLDDLSKLLTISEICSLLSTDGSKDFIIDKIWNGILQRPKYKAILEALDSQPKIEQFFLILSKSVSQEVCVKKIENLENTKKFLSDLCGPSKNDALMNDLRQKATEDALKDLLLQKQEITNNVLRAIANLSDPASLADKSPPLFCGPDSERTNGSKIPVFETQTHPSQDYLSNFFNSEVMDSLQIKFEEELQFYKPILYNTADEFELASATAAKIVGSLYEPSGKQEFADADKEKIDAGADTPLGLIAEANTVASDKVAPNVVAALNSLEKISSTESEKNLISFFTPSGVFDKEDEVRLDINLNFGQVNNVPAKTIKLNFGNKSFSKNIDGTQLPYVFLSDDVFSDPETGGVNKADNLYENKLLFDILRDGKFYVNMLDQIIKEHAEYISNEDLFSKDIFDAFPLEQVNAQCKSILNASEIAKESSTNGKALQCQKNFGAIPTPQEISDINAYVELAIKIITIQEYLKCLLVFGTFGIDSLLPEPGEDAPEETSFFYKYIREQIYNFLEGPASGWKSVMNQYSRQVYAARQNKSYGETSAEETLEWILSRQFKSIRTAFAEKLADVNLDKNGTLIDEIASPQPPSYQVIKNLFAKNEDQGYFDPPEILDINFQMKYFEIEPGYYSDNPRLANGGFFVEYGFEAAPKFAPANDQTIDSNLKDKLKNFSAPTDQIRGLIGNRTGRPLTTTMGEFIGGDTSGKGYKNINTNNNPQAAKAAYNATLRYMGKLSLDDYDSKYSLPFDAAETSLIFGSLFGESPFTETEVQSILDGDKLYSEYNFYYSFNLLLPVESTEELAKYSNFWLATKDEKYDEGFLKSVLERKMFLREGKQGKIFLKLPIVVKKELDTAETTKDKLNTAYEFRQTVNTNVYNTSAGKGLLRKLSDTPQFKEFTQSIFYKDLLSYLALLTAEVTEKEYPQLLNLFPQTLATLEALMSDKLRVADREVNPNFYQIDKESLSVDVDTDSLIDQYSLIVLKVLVTAAANVTDPLWRTPWYLPGPSTPHGVIAKILNRKKDDGKKMSAEDAARKANEEAREQAKAKLNECGTPELKKNKDAIRKARKEFEDCRKSLFEKYGAKGEYYLSECDEFARNLCIEEAKDKFLPHDPSGYEKALSECYEKYGSPDSDAIVDEES